MSAQDSKKGRLVDIADLLTQRKRNNETQVTQSKKALGIYNPSLNSRGFDIVSLQMQNGINSLLNSSTTAPVLNTNLLVGDVATLVSGEWIGTTITIPSGITLTILVGERLKATVINNGQFIINGGFTGKLTNTGLTTVNRDVTFDTTTNTGTIQLRATASAEVKLNKNLLNTGSFNIVSGAVLRLYGFMYTYQGGSVSNQGTITTGLSGTGSEFNVSTGGCGVGTYTGVTVTTGIACPPSINLTPLYLFNSNVGNGMGYSAAYGNNKWVITGQSSDPTAGNDTYYGALTNLGKTQYFPNGYGISVKFANNTWGIIGCGDKDLAYGSDPASLTTDKKNPNGLLNFITYGNNIWMFGGQNSLAGSNLFYGSDLGALSELEIFGGAGGSVCAATYADGMWVIGGQDASGSGNNVIYGSDLVTATDLPIFEHLGGVSSVTYADTKWVITGFDFSGSGYNVYAGSDITNLTAIAMFGDGGGVISAAYGAGVWGFVGLDTLGVSKLAYGTDLFSPLTERTIFSTSGQPNSIVYAGGKWVICGKDDSGLGNNVLYGTSLASLTGVNMFGNNGKAKNAEYQNGIWVISGESIIGNSVYYGNF